MEFQSVFLSKQDREVMEQCWETRLNKHQTIYILHWSNNKENSKKSTSLSPICQFQTCNLPALLFPSRQVASFEMLQPHLKGLVQSIARRPWLLSPYKNGPVKLSSIGIAWFILKNSPQTGTRLPHNPLHPLWKAGLYSLPNQDQTLKKPLKLTSS